MRGSSASRCAARRPADADFSGFRRDFELPSRARPLRSRLRFTGRWCNGSTGDFDSPSQGSNPCRPTPPISFLSSFVRIALPVINNPPRNGPRIVDTDLSRPPKFISTPSHFGPVEKVGHPERSEGPRATRDALLVPKLPSPTALRPREAKESVRRSLCLPCDFLQGNPT
jgi:hypothetical protein